MTDDIRFEFEGLTGYEALVTEGILLGAGDGEVSVERPDSDAGIDPFGIVPFLLVILLGTGTAGYIVRTVMAVRRQFAPLCIIDTRGSKTKIRFDKRNGAMRGKILLISKQDQTVSLDEDAGLDKVTEAITELFKHQ